MWGYGEEDVQYTRLHFLSAYIHRVTLFFCVSLATLLHFPWLLNLLSNLFAQFISFFGINCLNLFPEIRKFAAGTKKKKWRCLNPGNWLESMSLWVLWSKTTCTWLYVIQLGNCCSAVGHSIIFLTRSRQRIGCMNTLYVAFSLDLYSFS